MKKKFEVIIERVPIMTPIAFIWDTSEDSRTIGIIITCFVIGIKLERRQKNDL